MREQRGFTLVELSVVLLIIAILAVWGIPSWTRAAASARLSDETLRLASDLQLARMQALTRGSTVAFGHGLGDMKYWYSEMKIWFDSNGDCVQSSSEDIVRADGLVLGRMIAPPADTCVSWTASGARRRPLGDADAQFKLCSPAANKPRFRIVTIVRNGRIVVTEEDECPTS